jgi:hypothetical protein
MRAPDPSEREPSESDAGALVVPRAVDRLERMARALHAVATGTGRTVTVPRAIVREHAVTAEVLARELRGAHGEVPTRTTIPRSVQQHVLDRSYDLLRDAYVCAQCGREEPERHAVHLDHVVPVARGGGNAADNLRVLCAACNLRKGASAA